MTPHRCVCHFCGAVIDSYLALRLARIGGRVYCDQFCQDGDDFDSLERWAAQMETA